MTNSSIYEKIVEKGQLQSKEILTEGKLKAKAYHDEELAIATSDIENLTKNYHDKLKDQMKTKLTEIEQKAKQTSLGKKKQLIDNVFLLAKEKLINLDDSKLSSFVLKKIEGEKLDGTEVIKVSKLDFSRYQKLFSSGKKENNEFLLDKINPKLRLSNQFADISGGFIIVGKNYDVNYSYEAILENLKDIHETEVANLLFGGK